MNELLLNYINYFVFHDLNFLWIGFIALLIVFSAKLFRHAQEFKGLSTTKSLYTGYAIFYLSFVVSRFFNLLANFYLMTPEGMDSFEFLLFKRICYVIGLLAFAFLIYTVEHNVLSFFTQKQTILAWIPLYIAVSAVFLPYEMVRTMNYIGGAVNVFVIAWMYFYIGKSTAGDIRSKSFRSLVGIAVFAISIFMDGTFMREWFDSAGLHLVPHVIAPLAATLGFLLFYYSLLLKME